MGTRFMATKEAPIHVNVKQQLVENDERDTVLIYRSLRNTARVAKNAISNQVVEIEAKGGMKIEDIAHLVKGERGISVMEDGDLDAGIWSGGMIQGLIHNVPTCKELVERIVADAEEIINSRLAGMNG